MVVSMVSGATDPVETKYHFGVAFDDGVLEAACSSGFVCLEWKARLGPPDLCECVLKGHEWQVLLLQQMLQYTG